MPCSSCDMQGSREVSVWVLDWLIIVYSTITPYATDRRTSKDNTRQVPSCILHHHANTSPCSWAQRGQVSNPIATPVGSFTWTCWELNLRQGFPPGRLMWAQSRSYPPSTFIVNFSRLSVIIWPLTSITVAFRIMICCACQLPLLGARYA